MMKFVATCWTETRSSFVWHLGWFLAMIGLVTIAVIIYPGEEAIEGMLPLLEDELFEAFLGQLGGVEPSYTLWIGMFIPFMSVFVFLYGMMSGVRVAVQSVTEGTGELVHTLPVSRTFFLLTRSLVAFAAMAIYFLAQFVLLSTPFWGSAIVFNDLVTVTWWGLLFGVFSLFFGVGLGLVAGNSTRGMQFGLLAILVFYAMQILGRVRTEAENLNEFNPLNFYKPESVVLAGTMEESTLAGLTYPTYPVYLVFLVLTLLLVTMLEFNRKDLTDDAGVSLRSFHNLFSHDRRWEPQGLSVVIFNILASPARLFKRVKTILFPKSVRNNPFVFWGRGFENRFPFAADFVYSDHMTIMVAFLGILMFYPFQLMLYPGDELIQSSIQGFGSTGFMQVFTYGYDLSADPYLWFVTSQALGISWLIMLPLCYFWVRKAFLQDGRTGAGEILGSTPTPPHTVVFQRMVAIVVELVGVVLLMTFWLVLSELVTGSSYDLTWEVVALLASIPFYLFLITCGAVLSLLFRERGNQLVMIFLAGVLVLFLVSILSEPFDHWVVRGLFGLYDPVAIMQEKSLLVSNGGVVVLAIGSVLGLVGVRLLSSRYSWLILSQQSERKVQPTPQDKS